MKTALTGLALGLSLTVSVTSATAQEALKIGFAPPVYDTLDYFGQFAAGFQGELEKLGVPTNSLRAHLRPKPMCNSNSTS